MERMQAKEVSILLGFTTTNLKNYANLLEENGLIIHRNAKNHREYTEHDIKMIRAMIYLNKEKSMLLEDAASLVMSADITDILSQQQELDTRELAQANDNSTDVLSILSNLLQEQKQLRIDMLERDAKHLQFIKVITERLNEQNEALLALQEEIKNLKETNLQIKKDKKDEAPQH